MWAASLRQGCSRNTHVCCVWAPAGRALATILLLPGTAYTSDRFHYWTKQCHNSYVCLKVHGVPILDLPCYQTPCLLCRQWSAAQRGALLQLAAELLPAKQRGCLAAAAAASGSHARERTAVSHAAHRLAAAIMASAAILPPVGLGGGAAAAWLQDPAAAGGGGGVGCGACGVDSGGGVECRAGAWCSAVEELVACCDERQQLGRWSSADRFTGGMGLPRSRAPWCSQGCTRPLGLWSSHTAWRGLRHWKVTRGSVIRRTKDEKGHAMDATSRRHGCPEWTCAARP